MNALIDLITIIPICIVIGDSPINLKNVGLMLLVALKLLFNRRAITHPLSYLVVLFLWEPSRKPAALRKGVELDTSCQDAD